MRNAIRDARVLYLKGILFVVIGLLAAILLLMEQPTVRTFMLLAAAIWGFCRAYYFAFYVIEKYVDPGFRFSGLTAFVRYWWGRR